MYRPNAEVVGDFMTVYILGGSSTVMSNGWADSFVTQVVRAEPVRNLAIGAGNTLMAYFRLVQEIALQPGDTVVCASTIGDAVCLSRGGYKDGGLLRYTEEMIRYVSAAGARYVPVLMDTVFRDLDMRQAAFKAGLVTLFRHYDLDWVDVTVAFTRETGRRRVPVAFYDSTGHIEAGSEMSHFIADLVADAVRAGGGHPGTPQPLHVDPARPLQVVTEFASEGQAEAFANSVISATVWAPALSLDPGTRPAGPLDLEALILIADPAGGAFSISTPQKRFSLSAQPVVDYYHGPMFLSAYLPNLIGESLSVAPGDPLQVAWDASAQDVRSDVFFEPKPKPGPSRARLASMIFRRAA